jgi:hypothetical protein
VPIAHLALAACWLLLPVAGGPAISDALASTNPSAAPRWSLALWGAWAVGAGALAAPRTTTLTTIRLLAPCAAALGLWTALEVDADIASAAAASAGVGALVLSLTAAVGARFVDGSSYGDERRVPLRTPFVLGVAVAPVVVALTLGCAATGPALLLAGDLIPGALATVVGWPVAAILVRALHRLHRRWLVLVPAGIVVHDHLVLAEPVLVLRKQIARFGPALADSDACDLTAGAAGLVLQLDLHEPVTLGRAVPRGADPATESVTSLLVAPVQPGATLTEAARRKLVG